MQTAYVKQLIQNGDGKFNVVRLEAETEAELNAKRDTYLGADYQDATEAEYEAQLAERDERQGTEGGAEKSEVEAEAEKTEVETTEAGQAETTETTEGEAQEGVQPEA